MAERCARIQWSADYVKDGRVPMAGIWVDRYHLGGSAEEVGVKLHPVDPALDELGVDAEGWSLGEIQTEDSSTWGGSLVHGDLVVARFHWMTEGEFLDAKKLGRVAEGWSLHFGEFPRDGEGYRIEISPEQAQSVRVHFLKRVVLVRPNSFWPSLNGGGFAEVRRDEESLMAEITRLRDENRTLRDAIKILR